MSRPAISKLERQQQLMTDRRHETYWHRVRFELVGRLLDSVGSRSVVDFGAGSGLLGEWLQEHRPALDYHFTESSAMLAKHLVERFGPDAKATVDDPWPQRSSVVMLDVLEHIEFPVAALQAIRSNMGQADVLVITVPALRWGFSSWDFELGHFRRYSKRSLRQELAAAGFVVEHTAYLFPELLPLLVVRKLRSSPRQDVDFPELPPVIASVGYRIAAITTALRSVWVAGTSVVAVARNPA